jgi:hypothetical protein
MYLFVNNMADPDISDYQFDADADDLFRRGSSRVFVVVGVGLL